MTDPCSKEMPVIRGGCVDWRGASVPDSGLAVHHASVDGHVNPRQRPRIRQDSLGCLSPAQHGVHLHFIQPGKPVQNAFIESFNGKFPDECLNEHWFLTVQEALLVIEPGDGNIMRSEHTAPSGI
jgi:transposase InsO family protein